MYDYLWLYQLEGLVADLLESEILIPGTVPIGMDNVFRSIDSKKKSFYCLAILRGNGKYAKPIPP